MNHEDLPDETHVDTNSLPPHAPGGIWAVELWLWRLNWSPQVRALYGVRAGYTPTVWDAIEFVDAQDRARLVSLFFRCVNQGRPFELDLGLTTAAGSRKRVRITGFLSKDSHGQPQTVRGIVQEVMTPERSVAEGNEEASIARLMAALKESEALACAIPHEVRAPLSAVHGFARAIAETESNAMSARGRHLLQRIMAASAQMDGLVTALLALAPLSTIPLRTERVDLSAMATDVLQALQVTGGGRNAELSVEPGLVVDGDPDLLRQLLNNLLGNAWKFSQGRDPARIRFNATRTPDGCVYCVKDNGVGFDSREAADLFVPFKRFHSRTDFGGNGIGLTIASRIVKRHAGRIWADANPGAGASFLFTLGRPKSSP